MDRFGFVRLCDWFGRGLNRGLSTPTYNLLRYVWYVDWRTSTRVELDGTVLSCFAASCVILSQRGLTYFISERRIYASAALVSVR